MPDRLRFGIFLAPFHKPGINPTLALQNDLTEVEDHLQYARRFYNGAVRIYNTRLETFPDMLIAGPFGFRQAEFFEAEGTAVRAAPRVEME